eukprot:364367-Chlamydomonas_euryale.AAC.12
MNGTEFATCCSILGRAATPSPPTHAHQDHSPSPLRAFPLQKQHSVDHVLQHLGAGDHARLRGQAACGRARRWWRRRGGWQRVASTLGVGDASRCPAVLSQMRRKCGGDASRCAAGLIRMPEKTSTGTSPAEQGRSKGRLETDTGQNGGEERAARGGGEAAD